MSGNVREAGSASSRFVVGIDLGTTNSALAFVDTATLDDRATGASIQTLDVPQVTAPGTLEPRPLLPSFLYLATAEELGSGGFALPWGPPPDGRVAGVLAAKRAAEAPDRVVSSAKSWLCNERIDRTAPILPWIPESGATDAAAPEVPRVSPLGASTAYLVHLREAWNAAMAADDPALRLEQQEIFLTVPASFDAVARDLTVRAASEAGFARVHLLEEPQAALYAWVHGAGEEWRRDLRVGDVLLVCDVGGGTTDFSVVLADEEEGRLALRRVAVGDHLLLGGDNMDLALAFAVRDRLAREGKRIDAWQFRGLVLACREAKERLLGDDPSDSVPLSILGRGKKLIGGTLRAELKRDEVDALLLDGFLPVVDASARAATVADSGLSELGLPFAADAAVTRHLATFLSSHRAVASGEGADAAAAGDGLIHPTALLFNGGVMQARAMQRRIAEVLGAWARAAGVAEPRILPGSDLTHAVARGAAYFGIARRGRGVRIRGGTARSYYVGIASAMPAVPGQPPPVKALCVVPFGVEEGTELAVPGAEFGLLVGQQARFRFFASSTRGEDPVGLVLDEWDTAELEELAPLTASLGGSASGRVPVRLSAHVTEIGTLELWFVARDGGERWKLEFTVRGTGSAS